MKGIIKGIRGVACKGELSEGEKRAVNVMAKYRGGRGFLR